MNKQEYIELKKLLDNDSNSITHGQACAMDSHIKEVTIDNLNNQLINEKIPEVYRNFIVDLTRYNFGCMEIDQFLMKLKVYPDYM